MSWYRPGQHSTSYRSGSARQRHSSAQFQTSAQTDKFDRSLIFERNAYEGLFPDPIGVISRPENETGDKPEDLEITNYKCVGSYSWINAARDTPTILVPGSPPQWKIRPLPFQVSQPDKGPRIIDQGGFRTSVGGIGYLLPVIAAVTYYNQGPIEEPPFDWSSVDIVADRAALRKLLRWANDKQNPVKSDNLFRLDLQLAGERTILINRVGLKFAEEHLPKTYREGFEKECTTPAPGCRNALDYNRIVSYNIGGLKMVIRFEADAYDSGTSRNNSQMEELTSSLQAASLQSPGTLQIQGLTIQKAGQQVPQPSILELNTRSARNRFRQDWSEVYCQLFLSGSQKHVVAYHNNGLFDNVEERMLASAPEFETAKGEAQDQMKKLMKIINRIRKLVMKEGKDSRFSLICAHQVLYVYKRRSQESCLPDEILELFE